MQEQLGVFNVSGPDLQNTVRFILGLSQVLQKYRTIYPRVISSLLYKIDLQL